MPNGTREKAIPLDLCCEESVCGVRTNHAAGTMTYTSLTITLPDLLHDLSDRLGHASRMVQAATAVAGAGGEREAMRLLMDVESTVHEANQLISAVTLISRLSRERHRTP